MSEYLKDIDLPNVSICTPTYNRNNFIPLMLTNLKKLDYPPDKLEWVIDDDGSVPMVQSADEMSELKKIIHPIKLNYNKYSKKREIGEKRNNMVKLSTNKICAMMDTDDMYFSEWLRYAISELRQKHYGCVTSNQMLFLFPDLDWLVTGIKCGEKRMGHESGMCFTKKHHRATGGFQKSSQGEGVGMIDFMSDNKVGILDITRCLLCICHSDNTINKDRFIEASDMKGQINEQDKNLIKKCLSI
tara:strand:+ start:528 stop:1259 length:732 start_codon:yes stop_codon:yes gene_type:complete